MLDENFAKILVNNPNLSIHEIILLDEITNLLSSLKRKGIITYDKNKNWVLVK